MFLLGENEDVLVNTPAAAAVPQRLRPPPPRLRSPSDLSKPEHVFVTERDGDFLTDGVQHCLLCAPVTLPPRQSNQVQLMMEFSRKKNSNFFRFLSDTVYTKLELSQMLELRSVRKFSDGFDHYKTICTIIQEQQ